MGHQTQHQGPSETRAVTPEGQQAIDDLAIRHGVSSGAVLNLLVALDVGQGHQAQFNHPDLGGLGQWSRGGMLMIGDMFNNGLKAKVAALCEDVAKLLDSGAIKPATGSNNDLFASPKTARWPSDLGKAASSGSQNDMHYAVFPDSRRLAIDIGGKITIYDTGDHHISGFGQQQGGMDMLSFTSQNGPVRLDQLAVVSDRGKANPSDTAKAALAQEAPATDVRDGPSQDHDAIFAKIEGLAGLHARGFLTREEYDAKKAELLDRL